MRLILASKSPRRHDILNLMGIPFTDDVCTDPETIPEGLTPSETVCYLARHKAAVVQSRHPEDCILGADTVVVLNGTILGKPHSVEQAKEYLSMLSGNTHTVYTGVALLNGAYEDVRSDATEVTFRKMSPEEIDWYVSTGEPFDKAGAYGLQGYGSVFVDHIKGNHFNVIGLPAPLVYEMLLKAGFLSESRKELS